MSKVGHPGFMAYPVDNRDDMRERACCCGLYPLSIHSDPYSPIMEPLAHGWSLTGTKWTCPDCRQAERAVLAAAKAWKVANELCDSTRTDEANVALYRALTELEKLETDPNRVR